MRFLGFMDNIVEIGTTAVGLGFGGGDHGWC